MANLEELVLKFGSSYTAVSVNDGPITDQGAKNLVETLPKLRSLCKLGLYFNHVYKFSGEAILELSQAISAIPSLVYYNEKQIKLIKPKATKEAKIHKICEKDAESLWGQS